MNDTQAIKAFLKHYLNARDEVLNAGSYDEDVFDPLFAVDDQAIKAIRQLLRKDESIKDVLDDRISEMEDEHIKAAVESLVRRLGDLVLMQQMPEPTPQAISESDRIDRDGDAHRLAQACRGGIYSGDLDPLSEYLPWIQSVPGDQQSECITELFEVRLPEAERTGDVTIFWDAARRWETKVMDPAQQDETAKIRAWAYEQGLPMDDAMAIPESIIEEYREAHR